MMALLELKKGRGGHVEGGEERKRGGERMG